ncbi:CPBP family intramembrane metalloprotease [bacterium]|nr:CPBP family intramembrane metalloprotease [bacterium]
MAVSWMSILRIVIAYVIYFAGAILTAFGIRRFAGDLQDFTVRNSPRVLLLGGLANVVIMLAILSLLRFWDERPLSALGLAFAPTDFFAAIAGMLATFLLAVAYLALLHRTRRIESIEIVKPVVVHSDVINLLIGLSVLVAIVLQEEILNRGYLTLNLFPLDPLVIIVVSTATFVLIHFLTNRVSLYQVVSWTMGGLVLVTAYLLSGSLWLAAALHYANDAANMLVFNITGQYSFIRTSPSLTEAQRAGFRVLYGVVILSLLVSFYGVKFHLPG